MNVEDKEVEDVEEKLESRVLRKKGSKRRRRRRRRRRMTAWRGVLSIQHRAER